MINISSASIIKQLALHFKHWRILYKQKSHSTQTDLLFLCGLQHALPGGSDDGDVLMSCGVAVSLDNMSQSQAADHSLQNLLHVAEAQARLRPNAGLHQLHGAWDQSNLACTENRLIYLGEKHRKGNTA